MRLKIFTLGMLQNCLALLAEADADGITENAVLRQMLQQYIAAQQAEPTVTAGMKRRPDNITVCSVCGRPAVIMALAAHDRTTAATHAIQCQNRPATDQLWDSTHCGHTEYILRGGK